MYHWGGTHSSWLPCCQHRGRLELCFTKGMGINTTWLRSANTRPCQHISEDKRLAIHLVWKWQWTAQFFWLPDAFKIAIQAIRHHNQASLVSEEENTTMLEKLPKNHSDQWSCIVDKWLNNANKAEHCYPPFSTFCNFLEQEACITCNRINSKHSTARKVQMVVKSYCHRSTSTLATNVWKE